MLAGMRRWLIMMSVSAIPAIGIADSDCLSVAKTELENIYCRVAATPEAGKLPSFSDFRRNTVQVQALLLKRPAERLGIQLPKSASRARPQQVARVESPPPQAAAPKPARSSSPKGAAKVIETATSNVPHATVNHGEKRNALAGCRLANADIFCPGGGYRLEDNRQNHQLADGALSEGNILDLPSFRGSPSDKSAVNNYLADSYEHYINKMLLIGLGGSTMTYTKFHYTFLDLLEKQEDFAARVGETYNYLKKDKASMAIQARYDQQMPSSIDWCTQLNDNIVVCDNGRRNWVYSNTSH